MPGLEGLEEIIQSGGVQTFPDLQRKSYRTHSVETAEEQSCSAHSEEEEEGVASGLA